MKFETTVSWRRQESAKPFSWVFVFWWLGGLVLVAALMGCGLMDRRLGKTHSPVGGWPHEESDLAPDPSVIFGRLENGLRYALMKNTTPPDRVSVHLMVQAGSLHELDAERGLAHFLEHMLFNGSTHFKPGELVRYFQSIGMQFGPDANARTGFEETVYDVLLPEGDPDTITQSFVVLRDYAEGALLLESEVERERKVILAEKRSRDSASYRTFEAGWAFEFPDLLLSRRLPIGVEPTIEGMTAAGLRAFYDSWYRPERMVLVLVGDFDPGKVEPLVARAFSSMKPRGEVRPEPNLGHIAHRGERFFHHYEPEVGSTSVSIKSYRKVEPKQDSVREREKALFLELADQMMNRRLKERMQAADAPFSSADVGTGTFMRQIAYAALEARSSPDKWQDALSHLEQALRQALTFGFTDVELAQAKKEIAAGIRTETAGAATRNSQEVAEEFMDHLGESRVFQAPSQTAEWLLPILERATVKKVGDAFRSAWDTDHRLVLVTGNAKVGSSAKEATEIISSVFQKSRSIHVDPPLVPDAVQFPYLPAPGPPLDHPSQTVMEDVGVRWVRYGNGVQLLFKPTDFEAGQVALKAVFGKGRASEPVDAPGLSLLAEPLLNESGLGALDKQALERALAETDIRSLFKVEEDRFSIEIKGLSQDLERMFQLLQARLLDPGYRSDAMGLVKERYRQRYETMNRSVDGMQALALPRILAGGDARFGYPPPDAVLAYSHERVRQWLDPFFKESELEVAVVGDVESERLTELAKRYLGGLPERSFNEAAPSGHPGPVFPAGKRLRIPVDTRIAKSVVVVAYPSDDRWDIFSNRRLSTLAEIVSDRLRETVREDLGAAYSPYAYNYGSRAYAGYGLFQVIAVVDPDRQETVEKTILNIADRLAGEPVGEDELRRALDPTLTSIKEHRNDNDYWLQTVLSGASRRPEQIQWSRTILADYEAITAKEIHDTARRYLNPQKAAVVIFEPEVRMDPD